LPIFPAANGRVQNERRRAVRRLTTAQGSLEQDRFQRLGKLKDGVECFQKFDLSKQQEVIKILNIETGAKDACAALLQDSVLTGEEPEETLLPTPEETPRPTATALEEDRPAPMVRLLVFII